MECFFGVVMQIIAKVLLLSFCLVQVSFAGKEVIFSVLTLDEATKKIIEQNKSKVLGAKTELIDGKKVHVIKILSDDGRVQYLKVDVETGAVVK